MSCVVFHVLCVVPYVLLSCARYATCCIVIVLLCPLAGFCRVMLRLVLCRKYVVVLCCFAGELYSSRWVFLLLHEVFLLSHDLIAIL